MSDRSSDDTSQPGSSREFLHAFVARLRKRGEPAETITAKRNAVSWFLSWFRRRPNEVSRRDVARFLNYARALGSGPQRLSSLRSAMASAFGDAVLPVSPAETDRDGDRSSTHAQQKRAMRTPTMQAQQQEGRRTEVGGAIPPKLAPTARIPGAGENVGDAAAETNVHASRAMERRLRRRRLIQALAIGAGLGAGEIARLRWNDVDIKGALISIPTRDGRGRKRVAISNGAQTLLARAQRRAKSSEGFVFSTARPPGHVTIRTVQRILRAQHSTEPDTEPGLPAR